MSKGKKIKSFVDLLNRPVYQDILTLLEAGDRVLTAKEIHDKLFPLQSHVLDYKAEDKPNVIKTLIIPDMKIQTLNTYLQNLNDEGLIKKVQTPDRGLVYRSLTPTEWIALQQKAPLPSIDELLNRVKPEIRDKFKRNFFKNNDELAKWNPHLMNYTTRQYIIDKISPLKKEIDELLKLTDQEPAKIKITYGKGKIIEL